ncbi:hypothetical protein IMCC3135_30980 [Granulosicoccus antarcticus IMCC3135]|uniref:Uncharacterized protein n=1 Tax=Granulosicoccus antarcticus IMCC3135 TaxID=1192854 RepID=A0A2Z2P0E4_9GAMM|nr:hypothetical protein IMCC3135_30980 [Granulosicoccus antarcticus IMCC3135]
MALARPSSDDGAASDDRVCLGKTLPSGYILKTTVQFQEQVRSAWPIRRAVHTEHRN